MHAALGRAGPEWCHCGVDTLGVVCQLIAWMLKTPRVGSWQQSERRKAEGLGELKWVGEQDLSDFNVQANGVL